MLSLLWCNLISLLNTKSLLWCNLISLLNTKSLFEAHTLGHYISRSIIWIVSLLLDEVYIIWIVSLLLDEVYIICISLTNRNI